MKLKEITTRNYAAQIRRGKIKPGFTTIKKHFNAINAELKEFEYSIELDIIEGKLKFDPEELADVVLTCFTAAIDNGIDLKKVMETKMLYNEVRE
jgi:hypothetical protein